MKAFKRAFKKVTVEETAEDKRRAIKLELMRFEREVTDGLFGAVEDGRQRDFFCLNEDTWVWYEEWAEDGARKSMTTHYHLQEEQIAKSLNGGPMERLTEREVRHFVTAVEKYNKIVQNQIYS